MTILVYTNFFYPSIGGVERNTVILSQALQEINHEVVILTPTVLSGAEELPLPFPVRRTRNPFSLFNHILKSDIVIMNGGICLLPAMIAFLLKKKMIPIYQMVCNNKKELGTKEIVLNWFKYLILSRSFMIVGVSGAVLRSLSDKLPVSKKFVLYNPVSADLLQRSSDQENIEKVIDIVYVGRLIEGKGIYTLVEALRSLDKQDRKYTIQILGNGCERKSIIRELETLKNISFSVCEICDHNQIAEFYQKSKILVLPSSTHLEGSPLVIAEAFCFDLPVVASSQAANIEVVDKGGLIFEIDNHQDLSKKLSMLLDDDKRYKKYQKRVLEIKHRYSYQAYQEKLKEITHC